MASLKELQQVYEDNAFISVKIAHELSYDQLLTLAALFWRWSEQRDWPSSRRAKYASRAIGFHRLAEDLGLNWRPEWRGDPTLLQFMANVADGTLEEYKQEHRVDPEERPVRPFIELC